MIAPIVKNVAFGEIESNILPPIIEQKIIPIAPIMLNPPTTAPLSFSGASWPTSDCEPKKIEICPMPRRIINGRAFFEVGSSTNPMEI